LHSFAFESILPIAFRLTGQSGNASGELFVYAELVFGCAAQRALEILSYIRPSGSGSDSGILETSFFVIFPSAKITYVFHIHFLSFTVRRAPLGNRVEATASTLTDRRRSCPRFSAFLTRFRFCPAIPSF